MMVGLIISVFFISIILLTLSQYVYITLRFDGSLALDIDFIFLRIILYKDKAKVKEKSKKKKKEKKKSSPLPLILSIIERGDVYLSRLRLSRPDSLFFGSIFSGTVAAFLSAPIAYIAGRARSFDFCNEEYLNERDAPGIELDITARIILFDLFFSIISFQIKKLKEGFRKKDVRIKNE